jgi:hypothetical protein
VQNPSHGFANAGSYNVILTAGNGSASNTGTQIVSVLPMSPGTHTAASVSLADVRAAISAASEGDTVLVPAGSATWDSPLDIRKGVLLIGAGIGNTVITRGGSYIISYDPSNYDLNTPFRLSGFSFNGNGGNIMFLGQDGKSAPFTVQTKIRIDHNRFFTSTSNMSYQALTYRSGLYGVVDNNVFDTFAYPMRNTNTAYNASWWNSWQVPGFRYVLGDPYNIFFEDNEFNLGSSTYNIVTDSQYSGRYLFRYNTITMHGSGQTLFDIHGNQGQGSVMMWSSFGAELYGNLIQTNGYELNFQAHRGGKCLIFYNAFTGSTSVSTKVWESHDDGLNPSVSPDPQHPNDGYYWLNRHNFTGTVIGVKEDEHVGDCPLVNRDYFTDTTSNGPIGITSGPLASRPASGTYIGQGYWATDQSTTNLTNCVGKNPPNPIRGTLYKWTGSEWVTFYTPYPYPHPLRALLSD